MKCQIKSQFEDLNKIEKIERPPGDSDLFLSSRKWMDNFQVKIDTSNTWLICILEGETLNSFTITGSENYYTFTVLKLTQKIGSFYQKNIPPMIFYILCKIIVNFFSHFHIFLKFEDEHSVWKLSRRVLFESWRQKSTLKSWHFWHKNSNEMF